MQHEPIMILKLYEEKLGPLCEYMPSNFILVTKAGRKVVTDSRLAGIFIEILATVCRHVLLCDHVKLCRGCHYLAVKMAANTEAVSA
jgi:hypothetical protein